MPPVPVSILAVTSLEVCPGHGVPYRGRGLWNAVPEAAWLQGRSQLPGSSLVRNVGYGG